MISLLKKLYRTLYPLPIVDMYKKMGVQIGENCKLQNGVIIDFSHYWHITIGNNVTLAPNVHVLAHDTSTKLHLGYTKIGKVSIEDNVFIGAGSIILPGVTIGKNSIIGAGSIISKDIAPNSLAVGSPAKTISSTQEYLKKCKKEMEAYPIFDESYTIRKNVSEKMKQEMNDRMKNRFGFVE